MGVEKALEATKTYGAETVMLFCVAAFLAALIVYVLKQNDKREERLAGLLENELKNILEAKKYQRVEHEAMIKSLGKIEQRLDQALARSN